MNKQINQNQEVTLKAILQELDITQEKLAKDLGVSLMTVNSWVTGRKIPRFDNACQMANELGISLKTLAKSLHMDISNIPDNDSFN
jgi:transcriptional regulator with XRE-family HTH domain